MADAYFVFINSDSWITFFDKVMPQQCSMAWKYLSFGILRNDYAWDSSLVLMISFCTGVDIMARYQLLNNNNDNNDKLVHILKEADIFQDGRRLT